MLTPSVISTERKRVEKSVLPAGGGPFPRGEGGMKNGSSEPFFMTDEECGRKGGKMNRSVPPPSFPIQPRRRSGSCTANRVTARIPHPALRATFPPGEGTMLGVRWRDVKFSVRTPVKGVGRKISVHPGGWTLRGAVDYFKSLPKAIPQFSIFNFQFSIATERSYYDD